MTINKEHLFPKYPKRGKNPKAIQYSSAKLSNADGTTILVTFLVTALFNDGTNVQGVLLGELERGMRETAQVLPKV